VGSRAVVEGKGPAALAVAPATAQPVAWAWLIVRKDGISTGTVGIERGKMESHAAAWNRDEVAGFPFRVVPLYAAPPATGDAAAVGIAGLDFHVPRDRTPSGYTRVEAYMGNGHVVVMGSPSDESHSCDALGCGSTGAHVIARLPLPAPAPASKSKENPVNDIPRRIRIDLQTPIEAAIRAARDAVEAGPAHPHMTRATVLLGQALDAVADFVDGVPERADAPSTAVEEARKAFCDATVREAAMNGRWKRMVLGKPLDGERVVSHGEAADDLSSAAAAVERARLALLAAETNAKEGA